ncbi:MAG: PEP-utilizing enzyme [Nanoarchaeota archaeon]|nr:PEP-utilizing enzyme [Nanoarchaeota archaeon]
MSNLEGKIASQGLADARAFVTNDPSQTPPFEDYILITQNANPEISPLLYKAKGIITEVGGLMSHLAVVSRELKIPCITACEGCYGGLATGQRIRINATEKLNSRVKIEDDQ